MSTTDRILELLDNALEETYEPNYDSSGGPSLAKERCWRCMRSETPEGTTCAGCLAYMDGTSDEDPASGPYQPWADPSSDPMGDVRAMARSLHAGASAEMRTLPPYGGQQLLFSGPGLYVSPSRIEYGGHVIDDPSILEEVITVRHEEDGWMWVRWDLTRALELATASIRDSMLLVVERFRVAANSWARVSCSLSMQRRAHYRRHGLRLTPDPEVHPERLAPLVDDVMGRGPLDDPVLPTDDWDGWMTGEHAVPPWMPPTALQLFAEENREAVARIVGPAPALAAAFGTCPRHGAELYGGLCRRCHR